MFLDKKEDTEHKKYNGKMIIGLELTEAYSQISYATSVDNEPETLSLVVGQDEYKIPTVMGKKYGSEVWLFGKEAIKAADEGECVLLKDLLFHAKQGIPIILDEMEYDIGEILAVYIKKCLFLVHGAVGFDRIAAVVITTKELSTELINALERGISLLKAEKTQFFFATYQESFFQYVLHQENNLWMHDVVLFDYRDEGMRSMALSMNRRTTPIVTFIDTKEYEQMRIADANQAKEWQMQAKKLDQDFYDIAKEVCDNRTISAVYLLGDGFSKEWCKESLKYLCKGRRAFQGNNLYSKGACYMAIEKIAPSLRSQSHVYLAEDKLKSNLGMRVNRLGEECYMTLLDAGCSWYEAKKQCELILEDDNRLPIIVTPMDGKNIKVAEIVLDGLPIHGKKTNRIHVSIAMKNVKTVCVTIEDMGFGEFFPSSGQIWKEEFDIA